MPKKKKASKKAKKKVPGKLKIVKKKLEPALRTIKETGWVIINCPHCGGGDRFWSLKTGEQICSSCKKEFVINPPTLEERLTMEERKRKGLEKENSSKISRIWDLESRIRKLENTPWAKAKKKYEEYRAKPKKLWKDFLDSESYLVPRMHIRRGLYKKPIVGDVTKEHGKDEYRVSLTVKPNILGKKLKYPEFRSGYRYTAEYGWRRLPYYHARKINKGFEKYLDKVIKSHKLDNL